jgi:FKBP-type peptidyl-prolyl cis-trans isomerase
VAKANGLYNEARPYVPYTLTAGLGNGGVIRGWEEAIMLMKKGTKMRVWIPSTLAYGPQRRSDIITENSILVFDLELVDIK